MEIKGTTSSDPNKGLIFTKHEMEEMKNPRWRLIRVINVGSGEEKFKIITRRMLEKPVIEKRGWFRIKPLYSAFR